MITLKYKKIYEQFVKNNKKIHINPWHEINKEELNTMNINNDYNFKYFMDYIIKRLNGKSDAHTKLNIMSALPINFRIFDNEIIVNYPEEIKRNILLSINGINIETIVNEIDNIISYGTEVKKNMKLKNLFLINIDYLVFHLLETQKKLTYKTKNKNGEIIKKEYIAKNTDKSFDYDKYRYGNISEYKIKDNCLIYKLNSLQSQFKNKIENTINN